LEIYDVSYEKVQKNDYIKKIEIISGQNVFQCYQCGKCSANCPMADDMEYLPNQIMKLLQMGDQDTLIESNTHWICSSCLSCTARCPKGVKIAEIMEALRIVELRKGKDYWDITKQRHDLKDLPPIAIIANFRKLTG
jgi:heterodisulfide reductase subunit C